MPHLDSSGYRCNNFPMTARLYELSSSWTFPNSQREVWDVIADPDMAWPDWWPGCTYAKPLERAPHAGTSNEETLLATTANLKFKASLGYTLLVSYHPTHVESPREVTFDAGGDLEGEGRVLLSTSSAPQGEGRRRALRTRGHP